MRFPNTPQQSRFRDTGNRLISIDLGLVFGIKARE